MRFDDGAVLAQLMAQGQQRGADLATLRAIVEEAGELGAGRALARLGLGDERAAKDMAELRELLAAWRDAKKSAVKAAVGWVVRLALALVLVGLAVRLGFSGWVK
jgi:multidrug efflux pump subunit AcrA (membrane-fusion protein)